MIQHNQELQEERSAKFENEIITLTAKMKSVTEKYQASIGKYESLKEQAESVEGSLKSEIRQLRTQLESLDESSLHQSSKVRLLIISYVF